MIRCCEKVSDYFLSCQVLCVQTHRISFSRNILLLALQLPGFQPFCHLGKKAQKAFSSFFCIGPSQPTEIFHTMLNITTLNFTVLGVFTCTVNEQGTFYHPSCSTWSLVSILSQACGSLVAAVSQLHTMDVSRCFCSKLPICWLDEGKFINKWEILELGLFLVHCRQQNNPIFSLHVHCLSLCPFCTLADC